ncbi:MAG: AMP-binding protein [Opitutaceae bacterium]
MNRGISSTDLIRLGLSEGDANGLVAAFKALRELEIPPSDQWRQLIAGPLSPEVPFPVHRFVHEWIYADWDEADGPRPAWLPGSDCLETSNIGRVMGDLGIGDYRDFHCWSTRNRDDFWAAMIDRLGIRFHEPFREIRLPESPLEKPDWLPGARMNIAESCFQAEADAPAVVFVDSEGNLDRLSYCGLARLSGRVANGLTDAGFVPGDPIAVIMPMTVESVAIYLGIVLAGCVVVSISDSFAAEEMASRLKITGTKGVFTQDRLVRMGKSIDLYQRVVESVAPPAIVIGRDPSDSVDLLRDCDQTWSGFLSDDSGFEAVVADPAASTNYLFSSGTTGEPKVIPWSQTTPIKCATDAWLHQDIHPGDVLAWPTNLGWMMGPWLIYGALINRATIALFPDAPTGRAFGQFVQDAGVTMLGLVPSLVRSWRASRCMEGLDWSRIRVFSSTGECSNAGDMHYLMWLAGYRPVIEYCGGTEIGGAYLTGTVVQASAPATFSSPALGLDFDIVDEEGELSSTGEVLLVPPSIGLSNELLNADHEGVYFGGVPPSGDGRPRRRHGDELETLGGGYYRHHGRADDTMNLGGIKVSSVEIERILNRVDGVRESAAIAVPPAGGGPDRLVVHLVVEPGNDQTQEAWMTALQKAIREHLNPLFRVADVVRIDALPRTASNKVMRRILRTAYQEGHG